MSIIRGRHKDEERRWPNHVFGGRVRTSTLVLIVAFLAVWWTYDTYRPHEPARPSTPPQVVPPGFVPDPNYTWVPRTRVDQPAPPVTRIPTTEPTTTVTTPSPTTTTTTAPPWPPCLLPPPFCPPSTSPTPSPTQLPQPGPGPSPTPTPPAS